MHDLDANVLFVICFTVDFVSHFSIFAIIPDNASIFPTFMPMCGSTIRCVRFQYMVAVVQCFDTVGWAAGRASGL